MAELARFVVHRGNDPFTPPRSKVVFVKDDFGIKWPVVKYSYMKSELTLKVMAPDEDKIRNAVNAALEQAAIKSLALGLAAGFVSGGMAALTTTANTFIAELDRVVEAAVGAAVDTSYEIDNNSHWGDWQ